MASSFPVGSSILLRDLIKGSQYNDKKGIVKSRLNSTTGRQEVYVFEVDKTIAIRPINMQYEPREISSLSISEMKGLLLVSKKKNGSFDDTEEPHEWKGLDKEELQRLVAEVTTSPDEIAALVAKSNEPKEQPPVATSGNQPQQFTSDQLRQGAERMSQMSPEALRQQAATMKAMGPAALRNMNPQMANMSDQQINEAIAQMEAVANNPAMMKMAAEQMKNLSPEEMKEAVGQSNQMFSGSKSTAPTSKPVSSPPATNAAAVMNNMTSEQFKEATQKMCSLTPEQLRAQANYFKSVPMGNLRKMNPQMRNMTDDQIRQAIAQMEQMAENPAMMKMAAEQMKNMSPEQFESMKQMANKGFVGGTSSAANNDSNGGSSNSTTRSAPQDQSKMMESLLSDPEQLKSYVKLMKQNPDLLKQALSSQMFSDTANGEEMSEKRREQIEKAVDQFSQMDDDQLERYLKVATTVQTAAKPFVNAWNGTKRALGVSSKTLVILINLLVVGSFAILVVWWRRSKHVVEVELGDTLSTLEQDEPPEIGEGYGDSEF